MVWAVGFLNLIERLSDQKGAHAISCHEGQRCLEEVQPPQCRELVQHHQELAPTWLWQFFGQPTPDLIQDKPHQRLRARHIGGRTGEIERDWLIIIGEICEPPVASRCDIRNHGVTVKRQKAQRG